MKEDDISIEEGGLTIRKVKEALPKVVKVVSLVNIDRKVMQMVSKVPFNVIPKKYAKNLL